jgi:hypothetical protein
MKAVDLRGRRTQPVFQHHTWQILHKWWQNTFSATTIISSLKKKVWPQLTIILGLEFCDLALLNPNPVAKELTTRCFKIFFASATLKKMLMYLFSFLVPYFFTTFYIFKVNYTSLTEIKKINIWKKERRNENFKLSDSVADPDSGSGIGCLFDPWIRDPGWVKSQDPDPGSGVKNQDHIS